MGRNGNSSVQRLIGLRICRPSDIRRSRVAAKRLSTAEISAKLRQAGRVLRALGDPSRMKIMLLLAEREMCVCELESALDMLQPTISHHLGVLEQANLLRRSRRGKFVFYGATKSPALGFLKGLTA